MDKLQTYPLFSWVAGVVGTGFSIFTIARVIKRTPIPFAIYLLRYPTGAYIPAHRDVRTKKRMFHLIVTLTRPPGGVFISENVLFKWGPFVLFRPDLSTHSVTPVLKGTRYVLLIGWALNDRMKKQSEQNAP